MRFNIRKGDTLPYLTFQVKDENTGRPIALHNATVFFKMRRIGEPTLKVSALALVYDAENGVVEYRWQSGDTDEEGIYVGEFEIWFPSGEKLTVPRKETLEIWVTKAAD